MPGGTGMVVEMLGFPLYTHELSKVWMLHPFLKAGDLLVGDRGFCSFVHLAMLHAREVHGCFRCHQRQIVDFRPHRKSRDHSTKKNKTGLPTSRFVRRLGKHDQIVKWKRPAAKPAWMTAGQWEAIAALYDTRWRVETRFSELKTTLKMRKVKAKSEDGVRKELAAYCLVYNRVRAITAAAGLRQGVEPDRISFIDALRWLLWSTAGDAIPVLVVNPLRKGRHEPRVIKDLQDTYPKMRHPRAELRKGLNPHISSFRRNRSHLPGAQQPCLL